MKPNTALPYVFGNEAEITGVQDCNYEGSEKSESFARCLCEIRGCPVRNLSPID